MLEKIDRVGSLFELYGELLTPRQKELIEYYYFDDLSLAEIAEELGVSRQAVFFGLKRSEEILESYEKKLGLYQKSILQKNTLLEVKQLLLNLKNDNNNRDLERILVLLEGMLD